MSGSYSLEPPTRGKVVLKTTYGDLDIELWPDQAPLACRNFCQLIMEGYYTGTTFHRVIRNFMFQGGDPSGTGQLNPGDTIYGKLFKDEFHSRLKFKHRGLVGCANDNRPDSNGSMFFITLDRAEHLNKQATIFGRVCGDTLHNLSRFNEVDTDGDDRPEFPIFIDEARVLIPPFDDIVPRTQGKHVVAEEVKVVKSKVKNAALVSFEDEDFEDEGFVIKKVEVAKPGKVVTERDAGIAVGEKTAAQEAVDEEVLLDFGEDDDRDVRADDTGGRNGDEAGTVSGGMELGASPTIPYSTVDTVDVMDTARKVGNVDGVARATRVHSLVEASREKYVNQQKRYSSKRKKESDVLARIHQFSSSGLRKKATEVSRNQLGNRDGRSVLRQLDDLLHGS